MEIRKARVADADALTDLLTQLGYPGTQEFVREKIVALNHHPDAELMIAAEDNAVLGFISIHFIPQIALVGDFARISYLCVDEGARGRGIGGLLLSYAERLAAERNCDRIEVHSHYRRARAHEFYERRSFEESPRYLIKMV